METHTETNIILIPSDEEDVFSQVDNTHLCGNNAVDLQQVISSDDGEENDNVVISHQGTAEDVDEFMMESFTVAKSLQEAEKNLVKSCTKPVEHNSLTILSWNIDGLDIRETSFRAIAVGEIINKRMPDIVLLQEVVSENLAVLTMMCNSYNVLTYHGGEYFSAIFVKKDPHLICVGPLKEIDFCTSQMGRSLLIQDLKIFGHDFVVMTTHLESTKECKVERQKQLQKCFNIMLEQNAYNVILSGDLNLREPELKAVGGLPKTLFDAWQESGSSADTKFTWDLQLNDNLQFGFKPRARFDRMYYRTSNEKLIHCIKFELVGKERIKNSVENLFPSDHFGMLVSFTVA